MRSYQNLARWFNTTKQILEARDFNLIATNDAVTVTKEGIWGSSRLSKQHVFTKLMDILCRIRNFLGQFDTGASSKWEPQTNWYDSITRSDLISNLTVNGISSLTLLWKGMVLVLCHLKMVQGV